MPSRRIEISTGNILNKSINFGKGNEAAVDELSENLKTSLKDQLPIFNGEFYEIHASEELKNGKEDLKDRQDLKVTLKIFFYSMSREDLSAAFNRGLASAHVDYADTVVLSFSRQSEAFPLTLETVQESWSFLEEMVENNKVKMIGLSDIDTQLFIKLYSEAKVKPSIVQINLASCCVVPPELSEFCKGQDIQLLTHSDPINILPQEKLDGIAPLINIEGFEGSEPNQVPHESWIANWVMRYQVHLKTRGVLALKGYVAAILESSE